MSQNINIDLSKATRVEVLYNLVRIVLTPMATGWAYEFRIGMSTYFGEGESYAQALVKAERQIDTIVVT